MTAMERHSVTDDKTESCAVRSASFIHLYVSHTAKGATGCLKELCSGQK